MKANKTNMKKILFLTLTLSNLLLFPSQHKSRLFRNSKITFAPATTNKPANNAVVSTFPFESSNLNMNTHQPLQQNPLTQEVQSCKDFCKETDNSSNEILQNPQASPVINTPKEQDDDFYTVSEDEDFDQVTSNNFHIITTNCFATRKNPSPDDDCDATAEDGKIIHLKKTLAKLSKLCRVTHRQLSETIQQKFGYISTYDVLHNLAIEQKLVNHLEDLNQNDPGAGARFIDTAINSAIQHNNELRLKDVLLDIEKVSKSSLSQDTRERVSTFLIKCSHQRKRTIIESVAAYLQECEQDACLIRKFTSPSSTEEKRHEFDHIIEETQKEIEALTKRFSGDTLSVKTK